MAGETYAVSLDNNAGVVDGNFTQDFSGSMNGTFDWAITSGGAPEPVSWALIITGLAGLGGRLRIRRREARRIGA